MLVCGSLRLKLQIICKGLKNGMKVWQSLLGQSENQAGEALLHLKSVEPSGQALSLKLRTPLNTPAILLLHSMRWCGTTPDTLGVKVCLVPGT